MGFFADLFNGLMNQNNNSSHSDYPRREPTAQDYIRSGEIERDNYDDGKCNTIDEHGRLFNDKHDKENEE